MEHTGYGAFQKANAPIAPVFTLFHVGATITICLASGWSFDIIQEHDGASQRSVYAVCWRRSLDFRFRPKLRNAILSVGPL